MRCLSQGDHVALLSSFSEMGLKLRLDVPEQVMEIANMFFRTSTPAKEAPVRSCNFSFSFLIKICLSMY